MWIQTYSGEVFWPLSPTPETIHIEDIAHALSMTCRYAGHTTRFYSVAEHCCHLTDYFLRRGDVEGARSALLHDASEAYIADISRPIKPYLSNYLEIETQLQGVIEQKFGTTFLDRVKEADTRILHNERLGLLKYCPEPWDVPGEPLELDFQFAVWQASSPGIWKERFLCLFSSLFLEHK